MDWVSKEYSINRVDFQPSGLLSSPHLQSVLASVPPRRSLVRRRARIFSALSRDVIAECGAGVRLLGHVALAPDGGNGRMVVMIHGWEGSAESTYMLSVAPALLARGYSVFRLNLRDHGASHHLNEDLFHSCRLDEVVGAFAWIQRSYPDMRLSAVGYSLGGNFALRVADAAPAAALQLDRVVAVCPVLNPAQTMIALDRGWSVYRNYFIRRWRHSLLKKSAVFPERYSFGKLTEFSNLTDMTEYFVMRYTDFPDLYTYLNGYALTGERLAGLTVAASMLLADDDPVIPVEGLTDMHVPAALAVYRAEFGGHCGFLEGLGLRSWLDKFLLDELEK
jgi:predicted alpha/beta-fold hydrolase